MGLAFSGFGISVKGKNKALNQDYFLLHHFKDTLLIIVCDGLGSKKFSHIGAKYLAKSLLIMLRQNKFDFNDLTGSEAKLSDLWQKRLNKLGLDTKECSTTLLCAIINRESAYFGRVGDGITIVFADDTYILEDNDEFSNVTSPFGSQRMKWLQLDSATIKSVGLCSDGISEIVDSQYIKSFFSEYLDAYQNMIPQKREMEIKTWLNNFNHKGFCDDKSIVVAWRK